MECFQVRYDSRVVIYERKLFIRLATGDGFVRSANSVATIDPGILLFAILH